MPLDERTAIIVGPDAALASIIGRAFDPARSFPLPRALDALRSVFAFAVSLEGPKAGLVVGHTAPETEDAEALSKRRADVLAAWLIADPEPWLANFKDSVPEEQRWGSREDRLMLRQVPELRDAKVAVRASSPNAAKADPRRDELVAQYQGLRALTVDGIAGPITRKALILDYFVVSRTAQRADDDQSDSAEAKKPVRFELDVAAHGAGAAFAPEDTDAESAADTASADPPADDAASQDAGSAGRDSATSEGAAPSPGPKPPAEPPGERSDFFFFFSDAGVDPAPGAADGPELAEWLELSTVKRLFTAGGNSGAANQLSVQLFDKAGRVVHAKRKYTIRGPEEFAGFTDSRGAINIDDVTPGDYTLKLSLEFFEGADKIVDEFESPLLVSPGSNVPQVRMLGVVPRCVLARLRGLLFDTNKAFLLPSAIPDLKQIRQLYEQNDPSKLLIVGHTDSTATPSINDPLSLERAKSMLAYLGDNVDQWFEFYATSVPEARRWGTIEDRHMLTTLQRSSGVPTDADFEAFKAANGVIEDGVGDNTRKALIQKYMDLDGATLNPANITAQVHGCGENFPLDDSAEELDTAPANNKEDALDRRVELFFFDVDFGIVPKPPGDNSSKGSTQYPAWRKQADLIKDNSRPKRVFIQFVDDENEHLGELDYTLVTNDGFTVSRFTSDATVNELLPPSATSAILEIDGQRIEIDISEA